MGEKISLRPDEFVGTGHFFAGSDDNGEGGEAHYFIIPAICIDCVDAHTAMRLAKGMASLILQQGNDIEEIWIDVGNEI